MKQIYFIILLFFATALGASAQTTNIATLTQKAKAGDAKAQNDLGDAYYDGKGVTKNFTEAVKWFTKAAEQGYAEAQKNLGWCYNYGKGVEKNLAEAVKWYTKAAEQGNAKAQYDLGWAYYHGEGVAKDYTEAVKWYKKAAEQGNADAQSNLGDCYYNGEGLAKDFTEAVKWYKKAAEQGISYAQYSLAWCYDKGEGVAKNDLEAIKWYIKAAKNNNPDAAYKYGSILMDGNKQAQITKNVAEGVKYMRIAANQNNLDAIQILVGAYLLHMQGKNDFGISKYLSYEDFAKYLKMGAEQGDQNMQIILSSLPKLKIAIAEEKELVAKYGQKAYNNIKKGNVYVGMPEGILTAYKTIEDDGSRYQMYKYNGPYRDKVGTYKQYIPTYGLQLANIVGQVFPRIVKVRNGKVTNVIY